MTFRPMPTRLVGELNERKTLADRALSYHNVFLDDALRGILPHDLVLIGAPTGLGKTDLALSIAAANASKGVPVHYFALEAEPNELERRTKFAMLSRQAYALRHPQASDLNYADWLLGKCEHVCGEQNAWADKQINTQLRHLHTFYRGAHFGAEDLARSVLEVADATRLIVVDHLHYIDSDDDNEHRGLGDVVKTVRDVSLNIGKPIILIAHLRKRDARAKQLIATIDDFHGSSNISKICTQAIAIDHAYDITPSKWYLAPTYLTILKDRRAGAPRPGTAVIDFDRRTKGYREEYELGRMNNAKWEPVAFGDKPTWAKHHQQRDTP